MTRERATQTALMYNATVHFDDEKLAPCYIDGDWHLILWQGAGLVAVMLTDFDERLAEAYADSEVRIAGLQAKIRSASDDE